MGVRGLWEILGNAADLVETSQMNGKRLAIDTSIWMYELTLGYEKYQKDAKKELILASFVKRILKLLYLGIRPLFLFDGGVPMIKRSEIEARRKPRTTLRSHKAIAKRFLDSLLTQASSSSSSKSKSIDGIISNDPQPISITEPEIKKQKILNDSSLEPVPLERLESAKVLASYEGSSYLLMSNSDVDIDVDVDAQSKADTCISFQASMVNDDSGRLINPNMKRVDFIQKDDDHKPKIIASSSSPGSPVVQQHENNEFTEKAFRDIKSSKTLTTTAATASLPLNHLARNGSSELNLELLSILDAFGIPFIVCPMEADSQGAYLSASGLVDGIISNDNDIILYGGTKLYRNFFQSNKHIEMYNAESIEDRLGLSRSNLIDLAQLLGCDYSQGVSGVGPVLAMEIIAEFESLANFKSFLSETTSTFTLPAATKKWEKLKSTLSMPSNFPDESVYQVYRNPVIEKSTRPFSWSREPNFEKILSLDFIKSNGNLKLEVELLRKNWQKESNVAPPPSSSTLIKPPVIKSSRLAKAINLLKSRK